MNSSGKIVAPTTKHRSKWEEVDGRKFQSELEADRYRYLRDAQEAGEISELCCQVPIPCVIGGKQIWKMVVDFTYINLTTGSLVLEDTKGQVLEPFPTKKKTIEALYPIEIAVVKTGPWRKKYQQERKERKLLESRSGETFPT